MTQLRYFNAFIISSLTFLLMYFIFMALPTAEKIIKPAPSPVIKIALIEPVKKIVKPVVKAIPAPLIPTIVPPPVKKVEKKKPTKIIKKVIPKPKPKKVIKKKIVKKKIIKKIKPKKVVKKKIVKKKVLKKKVIKKIKHKKVVKKVIRKPVETYVPPAPVYVAPPVIYEPVETYVAPFPPVVETYVPPAPVYVAPKPMIQQAVSRPSPSVNNAHHKKAFLRNVRSKIIANKTYPRIAKRRHIEGSVKVRFDITRNGQVSNIRFINGKRIFQKSIRKTLERTFPMGIPDEVRADLPISDVSVVLHFNIR